MTSETLKKANEIEKQIARLNIIISDMQKVPKPLGDMYLNISRERAGQVDSVFVQGQMKERILGEIFEEYVAERTLLQKELSEL
jgi:hypothetical protein